MALKLEKNYKGITADYWKIIYSRFNAISNLTTVTLALFASEDARRENIGNRLEEQEVQLPGFLTIAESYTKIKESKIATREITPAVTEGAFPNITIVTPAVTEEYETNPFVNALDV